MFRKRPLHAYPLFLSILLLGGEWGHSSSLQDRMQERLQEGMQEGMDDCEDVLVESHKAEVDKLVKPLVGVAVVGLAVGLVGPEGTEIYGYGKTSINGQVPDKNTIFEIGSITKVFTSLMLSQAVQKKTINLSQPVQALLPLNVKVPINGSKVTLQHLSTHTAGFPMMASNFNGENNYTLLNLYTAVNTLQLPCQPGSQWDYSNFGMGLLGHALARKSNLSYAAVLKKEVLDPLGMKDTCVTCNFEQQRRFAQPHDVFKMPVSAIAWKSDAVIGAGGIRSTATDMVKFIAAQAGLSSTPLSEAMKFTQIPRTVTKKNAKMGLAWFISNSNGIYYHNGQTYGSTSYVGFDPASRTGVVVLSNSYDTIHIEALGKNLMKMMAKKAWDEEELPGEYVESALGEAERE